MINIQKKKIIHLNFHELNVDILTIIIKHAAGGHNNNNHHQ